MSVETEDKPVAATATPVKSPTKALAIEPDMGSALSAFASEGNFNTAQRIANALSRSSLVPKEYQGDAGLPNVLIALELASRTGASAFMIMQNLDIIHGRPSWRATFLIATVNASGRFSPLRFRFEGEPNTPGWGCRAVARDRETGEECVGALITMALAVAEGWANKSGSKWRTMPEQMMMYRAAAFWTRAYAPELSLGMQTADEIEDALPAITAAPMGSRGGPAPDDMTKALEASLRAARGDPVTGELRD